MSDCLRPCGLLHTRLPCPSLSPLSLLKLMSIESVMPSSHLILCHPLLLLSSIFLSIRVFSNESVLHIRWPKYWSFSFSISPSNEYSGLISLGQTGFISLNSRDSQESSPTPQFKGINSSVLSLLYGPTLTSVHDYWKISDRSESEVTQSCPTLRDPMDCSLPGSSVHGIFQAIVLKWIAISFSRGCSRRRDRTQVSCIIDRRFTI